MNELITIDQNFLDKFKVSEPLKNGSTIRQVRMNSETGEIRWRVSKDDEWMVVPSINGVIVGVYRKYVLDKWGDDEKLYDFQTTEFPFKDFEAEIKILDKSDYENIKELGKCKAKDFNDWCINYQTNVRSKELGADPFVTKKDNEIIKTFKAKYIIYLADSDFNIYRIEAKSGALHTINNFLWNNSGLNMFSRIVSVGFTEDKPVKTNNGEYHQLTINEELNIDDVEMSNKFYRAGLEVYNTIILLQELRAKENAEKQAISEVKQITAEEPKAVKKSKTIPRDTESLDIDIQDVPF